MNIAAGITAIAAASLAVAGACYSFTASKIDIDLPWQPGHEPVDRLHAQEGLMVAMRIAASKSGSINKRAAIYSGLAAIVGLVSAGLSLAC